MDNEILKIFLEEEIRGFKIHFGSRIEMSGSGEDSSELGDK